MLIRRALYMVVFIALFFPITAFSADSGKDIYGRLCAWCHGTEGRGDGVSAEKLLPPPRDLTDGIYKFTTTPYDEFFPSEGDIFNTIKFGLSDTSMGAWGDVLSDKEIDLLVDYMKELSSYEEPAVKVISYDNRIQSSEESIEKGRVIFRAQCTECHGISGGGDTRKRLKDDWGATTWPRNFSKPWSMKSGNSAQDIYARTMTGIPATQMPSYADENNKDKLSQKEVWHLANYVASLADEGKEPGGEEIFRGEKIKGNLPRAVNNSLWDRAEGVGLYLYPEKLFNDDGSDAMLKPTLDTLSARVLYNEEDFAILIEWDDFTKSIEGDRKADKIAGGKVSDDALALEFISSGDSLQWTSSGRRDNSNALWSWGEYGEGTWRIIIKAPLSYLEGDTTAINLTLLDGSNIDDGNGYITTGRKWMVLSSGGGAGVILWPAALFIAILALELLWFSGKPKE